MITRSRAQLLAGCIAVVICAVLVRAKSSVRHAKLLPLSASVQPEKLRANGYDIAVLSVGNDDSKPAISLLGNFHGVVIEQMDRGNGKWRARIRAGLVPGRVKLRIESSDHRVATAEVTTVLDDGDSAEDGTPDVLRLGDDRDRHAFRRWFTYLAEAQYFEKEAARAPEINDCAALIRYAYREALRDHDSAWANSARLSVIPALDSVAKYQYPFTPLQAALFRTRPGPFLPGDLADGTFLQFADAQTLWRFNTYLVSRDLSRALPGDLLFFRQKSDHVTFHSMIYLGESQVRPDGQRYVLYHTGPTGPDAGEIRRLSVEELLRFPQAEWRPIESTPSFLGVYRWNILRNILGDASRNVLRREAHD